MCKRVTCETCGKPTWKGCGEHIEEALAGVAKADRCQGHPDQPKQSGGFFSNLFGR
jgi:hypothetical protein